MRTREAYRLVSARRMALVSLLCVTGIAATCVSCVPHSRGPIPVGYLKVSERVLASLDALHDPNGVEVVACLIGRRVGHVVIVDSHAPARMLHADRRSALFVPCRNEGFVGVFHSHPSSPERCVMSETDTHNMYDDPRALVWIVGCGDGRFGYTLRGVPTYQTLAVSW